MDLLGDSRRHMFFLRFLHVLIGASKNVMFTLDFDSNLQFIDRLLPILIPPSSYSGCINSGLTVVKTVTKTCQDEMFI